MTIVTTTGGPTNSIQTAYKAVYEKGARYARVYDQYATGNGMDGVAPIARLAGTIQIPFIQDLPVGTTAISETSDVTPQNIIDNYTQITTTSRGEAVQVSELVDLRVFTDFGAEAVEKLGMQAMETVDAVAAQAALSGTMVQRATARASLDAGTTSHRWIEDSLASVEERLQVLKVPSFMTPQGERWIATAHPSIFYDLRISGNILAVGQYQDKSIILNWELGEIGPFKLVITPFAHVFIGQGSTPTSALSTTTAADIKPLDKTFTTTSTTNISYNQPKSKLNFIDAAETGSTLYFNNERAEWVSDASSVVTILGEGSNGGFRFAHASGITLTNNDSVYPVVYGSPASLVSVYDNAYGRYAKMLPPKNDVGNLDQWRTLRWKWYGGYGRPVETRIIRGEYSSSREA